LGDIVLKKYLEIGQIVGTHGIKGEVRINPWCDSPDFLASFKVLYKDSGKTAIEVSRARVHQRIVIAKLKGIDNVNDAAVLRNTVLFIDRDDAEIPKGSYFIQDLIGCEVRDIDSGEVLGTVSDVSQTGANDVWHIKRGEKEYLIPAIPDVVIETDVENSLIKIRPLKGIFDDED
jgi:16S rRNA processing protein RimM